MDGEERKENKEKEYQTSMRIKEDKLFPENLTQHLQPGGTGREGKIFQQSTSESTVNQDDNIRRKKSVLMRIAFLL